MARRALKFRALMSLLSLFISHVHEDGELASALKELFEDAFQGRMRAFVSSDQDCLSPGQDWHDVLNVHMRGADMFIILLTPRSLAKPWVNFEAGAAYGRNVYFIPVCARGLTPQHVGPPLGFRQLLDLNSAESVGCLLHTIGDRYRLAPRSDPSLMNRVLDLASIQDDDLPPPLSAEAQANECHVLHTMRQEYDPSLAGARQVFWETLAKHYETTFIERRPYPASLQALVDSALPPFALPLPRGEHLREYDGRYARCLPFRDRLLYDFCKTVYPARQPGRTLIECSQLPREAFEDFHYARRQLANWWDTWAAHAYLARTISLSTIVHEFDHQIALVRILCYLDVCLIQWTEDAGVGKQYLYRLCRHWTRA